MKPQQRYGDETVGYWVTGLLFALMLLLEGCSTTPPPYTQIAVSQAAVVEAESAGAQEYASGDLRAAQDKLEQAKVAINERNL